MKTTLLNIAVGALLALVTTTAFAANWDTHSCDEFVTKYCADVKPDGGAIAACFKQHESEVPQACKEYLSNADAFLRTCGPDLKAHCKGVKPGEGRLVKCLGEHQDALTPTCKKDYDMRSPETKK